MNESPADKKSLLRQSIFMLVATQFANIANLLFQAVSGRRLPDDEYGVLAAMLSIYLVASTPLDALRTAVAHFSTRSLRNGNIGEIRWIVTQWCWRLFWLAIAMVTIGYVVRHFAAHFFQLESGWPFVFACFMISSSFFLLLFAGVFQGMQNFYWMSASMHVWTFIRLGLLVWFISYSPTALSGLAAHGIATVFGLGLSLIGLFVLTRGSTSKKPQRGIGIFFIRSLLMLGSYAVLMNADLIFVKHYFSPDDAGKFAKAATVGRSVIFLPLPIALVMFPKVISGGTDKRDSRATFLKSLGLVVFLIIGAVGMTMTFPWLPLHILYGIRDPDPELIRLLIYVVCAMAPLSLSFLLMNYEIAQHRFAMTWLLAFSAFLYIAGVALWHDTMEHVVYVLGTVSTITTVGFCAGILLRARHRRHTGVS